MASAALPTAPTEEAPLRLRPDVRLKPQSLRGGRSWVAHDPAAERYYELGEEEKWLLEQLDGRRRWDEIRTSYEQAFAPRRFDPQEVGRLIAMLEAEGLILVDRPGRGELLLRRGNQARRTARRRRYGNLLAIRLPGIDPEPLLSRLAPWIEPLLTPNMLRLAGLFVLATLVAAGLLLPRLLAESRAAADFFTAANLPWLLVAVGLAKTIHELGHAFACRRLGGRCREVGLYLLCGAPCLYADVTSMWGVTSRWKRVAVDAAGLAAEAVVAACAFWLWAGTEPGWVHSVALNLAVVCSVGTLLVNANPLLRYDGYFILADLTGLTNLRERADAAWFQTLVQWLTGRRSNDTTRDPWWLAPFGAASLVYRLLIVVGIAWLLHNLLVPRGLTWLADAVALWIAFSAVVAPAVRSARRLHGESARRGRTTTFYLRAAALVGGLLALALIPWPSSVSAPAVIHLRDARTLYVTSAGTLVETLAEGATVRKGDVVARLENPELRRETIRLRGEAARRRLELGQLERRRVDDPQAADSLPTLRDALTAVEEQLRLRELDESRLVLTAPCDGTVVAVAASGEPALPDLTTSGDHRPTARRQPSPLEPSQRGAFLPVGTPLCLIGNPTEREAVALVEGAELARVRVGAAVEVQSAGGSSADFAGTVTAVDDRMLLETPPQLAAAGLVAVRRDDGSLRPSTPHYQVRIAIDGDAKSWPEGSTASVQITTPARSPAKWALRRLAALVHWEW